MSSHISPFAATKRPETGRRQTRFPRTCFGYNLLELAVVLAVIGTIAILGNNVVNHLAQQQQHTDRTVSTDAARQSLLAYLTRHYRLPCPDLSGDGKPGDASGACPRERNIGYLPYAALDLPMPEAGEELASRIVYGVSRASNMDLVTPSNDFLRDKFVTALVEAAKQPVTMQQPYVTGPYDPSTPDAPNSKLENCNVAVSNPAFVLVAPGTAQDTGTLQRGGVNAKLISTDSKCFAAPDRAPDPTYGDVVHAESKFELLGWFTSQIN